MPFSASNKHSLEVVRQVTTLNHNSSSRRSLSCPLTPVQEASLGPPLIWGLEEARRQLKMPPWSPHQMQQTLSSSTSSMVVVSFLLDYTFWKKLILTNFYQIYSCLVVVQSPGDPYSVIFHDILILTFKKKYILVSNMKKPAFNFLFLVK